MDIFEAFDVDQNARLCPSDIGSALEQLCIFPSQTQLFLWVKRFDRDRDGKLNVREFFSSLLPADRSFQELVRCRKTIERGSPRRRVIKIKDFLSPTTFNLLCELFKCQIENEVAIESVRQKLSKRSNFDLKKLFRGFYFINC